VAATAVLGGLTRFAGPLVIGSIASAIGALIGGAIWFGVAMATQYEIGWIAWAVGGLAGIGMYAGHRGYDSTAGVITAAMAVGGILLAKVAIFYVVLQPLFAAFDLESASIDDMRAAVLDMTTADVMEERGFDMEDESEEAEAAWDAAWEDARPEAEARLAEMTDDEVRERWEYERAGFEESVSGAFFGSMFGLLDWLFFGLAVVTAYRVGAGVNYSK
jgi:hypothetical protein